jgi:hypothetical protein
MVEQILKELGPFLAFGGACPKPIDHGTIHIHGVWSGCNGCNTSANVRQLPETKWRDRNRGFFSLFKNLKCLAGHIVTDDSDPDAQGVALEEVYNVSHFTASGEFAFQLNARWEAQSADEAVVQELLNLSKSNQTRDVRAHPRERLFPLHKNGKYPADGLLP